MRRILILRPFVALMLLFCVQFAQAQVTLTLNTPPQLPERVNDWERLNALFSVTVTNTGTAPLNRLRIAATVTNVDNNTALFRTKNDLTRPFNAPPRVPQTLTAPQILPANSFEYDASVQTALIRTNTLPEGTYRLCVRVIDERGATLGMEQCRTFNVVIPDPPSLISPQNGDSLRRLAPSVPLNLQFQWTQVFARFGQQSKYKLRVVPIFEGQQPRQALEGNPVLLEKIVPTSSYQWLPSDPRFDNYPNATGFVWQVQAIDPSDVSLANVRSVGRNEGKSEIFVFGLAKASNDDKKGSGNGKGSGKSPFVGGIGSTPFIPPILPKNTVLQGTLNFAFPSDIAQKKALGGATVQLVQYYILKNYSKDNTPQGGAMLAKEARAVFPDDGKVMATGVTDKAGNFTLSYIQIDSTGLYKKNQSYQTGIGEFINNYTGDVWRVFRLLVVGEHQSYYSSPSNDLIVQPGEIKTLPALTANVREYELTVKVVNKETKQPLQSGVEVLLLRKVGVSKAIPTKDEGTTKPQTFWEGTLTDYGGYGKSGTIISRGVVDGNGEVKFTRLVWNLLNSTDERYTIIGKANEGKANYTIEMKSFSVHDNTSALQPTATLNVFNEQSPILSRTTQVWAYPKEPTISGRIVGVQDVLKGLGGIAFYIYGAGKLDGDGDFVLRRFPIVTDNNGYFSTTDVNSKQEEFVGALNSWKVMTSKKWIPNGLEWSASIEANGYNTKHLSMGILNKGEKWEQKEPPIAMQPKALVVGRVVDGDNPSNTVPAYIRVGDVGVNAAVEMVPTIFGLKFFANAVPGNAVRVIIIPKNSEFMPETTYVNINNTQTLQNLGDLKVWKRGYRLHIKVAKNNANASGVGNTATNGIAGATIKLNLLNAQGKPMTFTTDAQGEVKFFLVNNASSLTFSVKPPPKTSYIGEEVTVSGLTESKYSRYVSVLLQEGATVTGTVSVGSAKKVKTTDNKGVATVPSAMPVANARVYVEQSGAILQTFTDKNGKYTLYGVEPGAERLIRAVKSSKQTSLLGLSALSDAPVLFDGDSFTVQKNTSADADKTFVGDSASIALQSGKTATQNFSLAIYEDMDIRSLLGYDIELTSLTDKSTANNIDVRISGNIVGIPKHPVFQAGFATGTGEDLLSFTNVSITPSKAASGNQGRNQDGAQAASTIPKAVPVGKSIILDQNRLSLTIGKAFVGELRSQSPSESSKKAKGLSIVKQDDTTGVISGFVEILPKSFDLAKSEFDITQGLYLTQPFADVNISAPVSIEKKSGKKGKNSAQKAEPVKVGAFVAGIPVFNSNPSSANGSASGAQQLSYTVVNAKAQGLRIKLFGFETASEPGEAVFTTGATGDSIVVSTEIEVRVEYAGDWTLPGAMAITKNNVEVSPENDTLSLALGKHWSFRADTWKFEQGSLVLPKGSITTGAGVIPFTNITLEKNGTDNGSGNGTGKQLFTLKSNGLDWSKFTIGGVLPIALDAAATKSFGYDAGGDKGNGCWKMQLGNGTNAVASLKNLPALKPNDEIKLGAISITSSEEKAQLAVLPNSVTVHALFPFKPQYLLYYPNDKLATIQGELVLGIPGAVPQSTALNYKNTGSTEQPTVTLSHIDRFQNLKIVPAGAVTLDFSAKYLQGKTDNADKVDMAATQKLDANIFEAVGFVYEKQGKEESGESIVEFKVKLRRTATAVTVSIEEADSKQTIDYGGGQKLVNITGGLKASVGANAAWAADPAVLVFEGDLTGAKGVQTAGDPNKKYQHLQFAVKGDVVCNSDKIGVENFDSGFGGMSITYDFARKALIGTLSLECDFQDGSLSGAAQFFLGSPGWYFVGGAAANLPSLSASGTALMIIGNAPADADVVSIAQQYSAYYQISANGLGGFAGTACAPNNIPTLPKGCPKAGEQFKGFFFEIGVALPVPIIPNINANLGIVNLRTVAKLGGSARLVANFGSGSLDLGFGIAAYAEAGVVVGASVGVGCITACVRGNAGLDFSGNYNTGTKEWSATLAGLIEVAGSLDGGVGACDSECGGLCTSQTVGAMTACFGASGTASKSGGISVDLNGPNVSKFTNILDIAEVNNPSACSK